MDVNITDKPGDPVKPINTAAAHRQRGQRLRLRVPLQISERRLLMMAGDTAAILIAVYIALRIWARTANVAFDGKFLLFRGVWFVILPVLWFIFASANDYFNLQITSRTRTSLSKLTQILMQLLILYLIVYVSLPEKLPRLFVLNYILLSFVLIGAWRTWQPFLLGWPGFRRRALLIGSGRPAEMFLEMISREASQDYEIVGFVCSQDDDHPHIGDQTPLGTGAELSGIVQRYEIAEVINTYVSELPGDVFQGMMSCYEQGISVVAMPFLYEQLTGRVPIEHIGQQYWVIPPTGLTVSLRTYQLVKRAMDIVLAIVGLLLFAVLLPFLAVIIKLDSPGPVFYDQERVGHKGKLFRLVKLRSMIFDAERDAGPQWAADPDPRVTHVGNVLRRMRLDELPQLLNVLTGEMSMIGPRPERPVFVEMLTAQIPFYRTRLAVKPGITGWAQVRYPYGSSMEDALQKLQYDLYYIRHQSIRLDIQIIARTVAKVLLSQGR